jgi:hypothetical protein
MAAILAAQREGEEHPEPGELARYRDDALPADDADRVRRHLAVCPRCTRSLLETSQPAAIEPAETGRRLDDDELDLRWQRFRERLETEEPGAFTGTPGADAAGAGDVVRRGPWHLRVLASPGLARAAALAFLLTTAGLSALLLRQPAPPTSEAPAPVPRLNVPIVELTPVAEAGERAGGGRDLRFPAGADAALLVLTLGDPREFPGYRIEVVEVPSGGVRWSSSDLRRTPAGTFHLEIPRDSLPAGRYELRLHGVGADGEELLARYRLELGAEP